MKNNEQYKYKKKVIAVCGKGGVGKTAFTAILSHALSTNEIAGKLLVIDADPAVGLPSALGVQVNKTLGNTREHVIETAKNGDYEDKSNLSNMLDYLVFETLVETDQLSLLAMGRTENQGCYCSVNTLLRYSIDTLMSKFDTLLIDGEAGLEQINRQIVDHIDDLIILTDTSSRGRETVEHIKNMIKTEHVIECKRLWVVINRVPEGFDVNPLIQTMLDMNLEILGVIPLDTNIVYFDSLAKPLVGLPKVSSAVMIIKNIANKIFNDDSTAN